MSHDPNAEKDFGQILEDFERRSSDKRPKGKIIRQQPAAPTKKPRSYERPTEDDEEDFGAALAAFDSERGPERARQPRAGEVVEGTIVTLDLESALVDLGAKAEGVVETDALTDSEGVLLHKSGDSLEFEVLGPDPSGALRLRPSTGVVTHAQVDPGDIVEGEVKAINKGGAEVALSGGRRAFCPFSQLADHRVEEAEAFIGRSLRFEVLKASERDVVLSRRRLLEREKAERAEKRRAELHLGSVVTGRVTAVEDYGVFVDIGDLEGLVHVSEMSHRRPDHPGELVRVGEEIEVKVTRLERRSDGRDRISLSKKALDRDPWIDAHQRFAEGTTAEGQVRRLESFGAFVELEPGLEGLVHISELGAGRRLSHPREVLEVGQTLGVRVLGLDPDKRRISLAPIHDAELAASEPSVRKMVEEHKDAAGGGFGTLAAALKRKQEKS